MISNDDVDRLLQLQGLRAAKNPVTNAAWCRLVQIGWKEGYRQALEDVERDLNTRRREGHY